MLKIYRSDIFKETEVHTMNDQNGAPKRRKMIFPLSTVVFSVLFLSIFAISNLPAISKWLDGIIDLLSPILWGAFIAYLCNPVLHFIEHRILKKINSFYVKRMLGIVLTYLFVILLIAVFGLLVIPQLVSSIKELVSNYQNLIANAITYVNQLIESIVGKPATETGDFISIDTVIAATETLISRAGDLFDLVLDYLASYGTQLLSGVTDLIMALFISFYLLSSKEKRAAQIRKVTTAFFSEKTNTFLFDTAHLVHQTFGSYFSGVILDAMFIGVLGFIVFSILKIPYAVMISFIVAITNIIPFFGPFLGAIPSAFIIFIADPPKVIPFVIAILVMQQIDGNIIAPKILGQSTGVSSLCVIIALSIMGGIWGIFGMIVGVPLFAVILTLVRQFAEDKLESRGLPIDLDHYYVEEEEKEDKRKKHRHTSPYKTIKDSVLHAVGRISSCRKAVADYKKAMRAYKKQGKAKKLSRPKLQEFFAPAPVPTSTSATNPTISTAFAAEAVVEEKGPDDETA